MQSNTKKLLKVATAILATCSAAPFFAQSTNQPSATSNAQIQTGTSASGAATGTASQNGTSASGQPLTTQSHEGFWGHLNPMARKKWVNRQVNPVKDRLNELDQLSAGNAKDIKDVDARSQAGMQKASSEAQLADQHAMQAGTTADQAQQLAQKASNQTSQINTAVSNMDQYQAGTHIEIRFRSGQSILGQDAKDALDQLASQIQGQRGYLIDVQGYSRLRGSAGVATSHKLASAVTRYLVTQHQIPLYKIRQIGLGNAPVAASDSGTKSTGSVVEVTLMHNSLSTLSASNSDSSAGATQSNTPQSSSNGTASQPNK